MAAGNTAGSIIIDIVAKTGELQTDVDRANSSIEKLQKQLQRMQKETALAGKEFERNFIGPMRDGEKAISGFSATASRANDGVARLGKGMQQNQGAFRTSNQVIQNTSYQLTDFIVQVQGGTSAMRAFSQQAPQFLGAFGPMGAALGIFAALGGAMADIAINSMSIKDFASTFDYLKKSAEGVESAIALTTQVDLSGLGKSYREATIEGKKLIDANISLSMLMLEMSKIDATATFRAGIQKSLDDMGFFTKAFNSLMNAAKYSRATDVGGFQQGPSAAMQFADITGISEDQANQISKQQVAFANAEISAGDYIKTLTGIADQYKSKLNPAFKEFVQNQSKYAIDLEKTRTLEEQIKKARENNYQGLEKANAIGENFIKALEARTKKVEAGEIAMLRMQAVQRNVLAEAEPLLQKLTRQEWDKGATKFNTALELSTQTLAFQNSLLGNSAQQIEVLNNAQRIRIDLERQLIDLKLRLGAVDSEVEAQMRANAESTIAIQSAMITSRQQQERSMEYGVQRGFQSYIDNAGNAAKGVEAAFSNAFRGMEDGIVQFAMTGKMNFADFANSVISDIMRIYVRMAITGLITKAVGSFAGAGSFPNGPEITPMGDSFADGGYTGNGGKYQPAGVVHAGEFVMNKEATSRIGVGNLYKMMRGYANGGYVGGSMPTASGGGVNINVKNEAGGAGYEAVASAKKNENGLDVEILVRKVMSNDLRNNGPMAQQMTNTFGLRRAM